MGYELITSSHIYSLQSLCEIPEKVLPDFDYVGDELEPRFVCYRGGWYDVFDTQRIEPDNGKAHAIGWTMRVHPGEPLASYDAIQRNSYFSAVAFRFLDDESVKVARIYY